MFTITWASDDFVVWAGEVRVFLSGVARFDRMAVPFSTEQTVINGHIHIEPDDLRFETIHDIAQTVRRLISRSDAGTREQLDREAVIHATSALLTDYLTDSRVMSSSVRERTAHALAARRKEYNWNFNTISNMAQIPLAVLTDLITGKNHYPLTIHDVINISKSIGIPLNQLCGEFSSWEFTGNPDADELCRALTPEFQEFTFTSIQKSAPKKVKDFVEEHGDRSLMSACRTFCECVVNSSSSHEIAASLALQYARNHSGLSIDEISTATMIPADLLSSVSKNDGQYSLHSKQIHRLCKFLDISECDLHDLDFQLLLTQNSI